MDELTTAGVRDDTIILFTSDESFGLEGISGGLSNEDLMLSQAWGVLVALLPSGEKAEIQAPHAQVDVAVSILDVLGLQHEARAFRGRSFFREYPTPRSPQRIRRSAGHNDPFQLHYSFSTDTDIERINMSLGALNEYSGIGGVIVRKATLSVSEMPPEEPVRALTILEYSHPLGSRSESSRQSIGARAGS